MEDGSGEDGELLATGEATPDPALAHVAGASLAAGSVRRLNEAGTEVSAMGALRLAVAPAQFLHVEVGVGLRAKPVCDLEDRHSHSPNEALRDEAWGRGGVGTAS